MQEAMANPKQLKGQIEEDRLFLTNTLDYYTWSWCVSEHSPLGMRDPIPLPDKEYGDKERTPLSTRNKIFRQTLSGIVRSSGRKILRSGVTKFEKVRKDITTNKKQYRNGE